MECSICKNGYTNPGKVTVTLARDTGQIPELSLRNLKNSTMYKEPCTKIDFLRKIQRKYF